MLLELGRRFEFDLITVTTARDEKEINLPLGARGFRVKSRTSNAKLRVSNIEGEVAKASGGEFITIDAGEEGDFVGIRVMTEQDQKYYVTSESDNTVIEVVIIPGF